MSVYQQVQDFLGLYQSGQNQTEVTAEVSSNPETEL